MHHRLSFKSPYRENKHAQGFMSKLQQVQSDSLKSRQTHHYSPRSLTAHETEDRKTIVSLFLEKTAIYSSASIAKCSNAMNRFPKHSTVLLSLSEIWTGPHTGAASWFYLNVSGGDSTATPRGCIEYVLMYVSFLFSFFSILLVFDPCRYFVFLMTACILYSMDFTCLRECDPCFPSMLCSKALIVLQSHKFVYFLCSYLLY